MIYSPEASQESSSPPVCSVIVPCYNERHAIRETIAELHQCLAEIGDYELIVVDDGSTDGSREVLREVAERDRRLELVEHAVNRGYGAALKSGIRVSQSSLLAITDADGTYPNERLPELIHLAEDADMVVGARTSNGTGSSWLRRIPKSFLRLYSSLLVGRSIPDLNSGLRVFRRSAVEPFLPILPDGFSFTSTITLAMLTNNLDVRFQEIGYKRRVGRSKIRPVRDTLNFFQLILRTAMYFAPLRVFLPVAAALALGFLASLGHDLYTFHLTQKTLMLALFCLHSGLFALLADMIGKSESFRIYTNHPARHAIHVRRGVSAAAPSPEQRSAVDRSPPVAPETHAAGTCPLHAANPLPVFSCDTTGESLLVVVEGDHVNVYHGPKGVASPLDLASSPVSAVPNVGILAATPEKTA